MRRKLSHSVVESSRSAIGWRARAAGVAAGILAAVLPVSRTSGDIVECMRDAYAHSETELVETGDYRLEIESATGAVGDVIGLPVYFHSRFVNPGFVSMEVAVCHDPDVLQPLAAPRFTSETLESALHLQSWPVVAGTNNGVGYGRVMYINFLSVVYDERFPSDEPMMLAVLYYRVIGEPGDSAAVSLCDGALQFGLRRCTYTYIHAYDSIDPRGTDYVSTGNVDGTVTVREGPATNPDLPPQPVEAAIYDETPTADMVNFRLRVSSRVVVPGELEVPIDVFASADVEYPGVLAALDFDERYLRVAHVQRRLFPGTAFFDNRDDEPGAGAEEGWVVVTNLFGENDYRLAPAGEEVHIATVFIDVLPAAAEVSETHIGVRPVTDHRGITFVPAVLVRHREGLGVGDVGSIDEILDPIEVIGSRLQLARADEVFERGDSNLDGTLDLSDAQHTLNHLFLGGAVLACADAADTNDSGRLDLSDAIYTLSYLFLGGSAPPPPHGRTGPDPTPDELAACVTTG